VLVNLEEAKHLLARVEVELPSMGISPGRQFLVAFFAAFFECTAG
jgi:hypothetical protein